MIHPDAAYGYDAMFEPGVSLRVLAKLVGFGGAGRGLTFLPNAERPMRVEESELKNLASRAGYAEGIVAWRHFAKAGDLVSMEEVVSEIRNIQTKPVGAIDVTVPNAPRPRIQCVIAFEA